MSKTCVETQSVGKVYREMGLFRDAQEKTAMRDNL